MYLWIKTELKHGQTGCTHQQTSRNLRGEHTASMTVQESELIVANADSGLFPEADIGMRAVIDEAHRTVCAARRASRSDRCRTQRGKAITGASIGAGTAVIGATIWCIPIMNQLAG